MRFLLFLALAGIALARPKAVPKDTDVEGTSSAHDQASVSPVRNAEGSSRAPKQKPSGWTGWFPRKFPYSKSNFEPQEIVDLSRRDVALLIFEGEAYIQHLLIDGYRALSKQGRFPSKIFVIDQATLDLTLDNPQAELMIVWSSPQELYRGPIPRDSFVNEAEIKEPDAKKPNVNIFQDNKPEVKESDLKESDISKPNVDKPDVSGSDVRESDVSEPDVGESDASESDISESAVTGIEESDVDRPSVSGVDVNGSGDSELDFNDFEETNIPFYDRLEMSIWMRRRLMAYVNNEVRDYQTKLSLLMGHLESEDGKLGISYFAYSRPKPEPISIQTEYKSDKSETTNTDVSSRPDSDYGQNVAQEGARGHGRGFWGRSYANNPAYSPEAIPYLGRGSSALLLPDFMETIVREFHLAENSASRPQGRHEKTVRRASVRRPGIEGNPVIQQEAKRNKKPTTVSIRRSSILS
ncbi:MAG: hypothetical protein M1837_007260 [Sclerophora amabilis]|nr:MAG: hypothetical protein M1837_007260 [Sclerophora amabilis]